MFSLRSVSSNRSGKGIKASKASFARENKNAKHIWLQLTSDASRKNDITYDRDVELNSIQHARQAPNSIAVQKSLRTEIENA